MHTVTSTRTRGSLVLLALAAAALLFVALASPVVAARVKASISIADGGGDVAQSSSLTVYRYGDQISFTVDADVKKESDLAKLWVANKCWQGDELVSAEYLAVHDGVAGPFTLDHVLWESGGADCEAYVWLFPRSEAPLRGATVSYEVGP